MDVRGSLRARLFSCAIVMVLALTGASTAFAQVTTGSITGTVVDNVGVVPGATVTVTNASVGITRTAVTNEQGSFRIPTLPVGQYSLKVTMEGFKQIDMTVPLSAGENRDLQKLTLTVGGRTETVNVTAEVTPVQTSSSALQKNLSGDLLTSVQVKGRDIFGMLKILPGVIDAAGSRDFAAWASGRSLSINGGNSLNKNTTIDGVPVGEEGGNGTTHITPNIDSVAEVNIVSSGYTAENGRMASGQVAMVTKSGTNEFKGSAWYNYRRDSMNKNDFFRLKSGNAKPFFKVNISGFSFGGPVIIPGVINSRTSQKKVFFFASEEYTQDVRPTVIARTNLPTERERAGDFSQTFFGSATGDAAGNFISGTRTLNALTVPSGLTNFWCAAGTGGISGTACSPTSTAGSNVINPAFFDPTGRALLALMPMPNNIYNPAAGQLFNANDARDTLPIHIRKNFVFRTDTVLSQKTRFSVRALFDRDDSTTYNRVAPGIGSVDNPFPGNLVTGTLTQVIKPTVVNEVTIGFSQNHWGFQDHQGPIVPSDYNIWFRGATGNPYYAAGTVMPNPPRFQPYLAQYYSTDPTPLLGTDQAIQLPFLPDLAFAGGNRSGLGLFRPSGGSGPIPRRNTNFRYTLNDDLSMVRGRHSFKFGFSAEMDSKTEPGNNDVNGVYSFSHSSDNPLSTGNGYANALIGAFTSYTERDVRIDYDIRHWLTEGYAQDTWRVSPRLTLDYGVRVTHNGSLYDVRNFNTAFDPSLYKASSAPAIYRPVCTTGVVGTTTCSTANQRAMNPLTGALVNRIFAGQFVPNTGNIANGQYVNGQPGKDHGVYDELVPLSFGPRVGFAWDVNGNGKMAVRGATGIFYNLFNRSNYGFTSGPLISLSRSLSNAYINDVTSFGASGNLSVSPQTTKEPFGSPLTMYGNMIAPTQLQAEKHYQANFAVQRDIGFSTVVEVAYVGNFGRHYFQTKTTNNVPVYAFANPANVFNNDSANMTNLLRRNFLGIGAVNYGTSDMVGLNYNSLQISVQRRLSHGLQLGAAYTLAKGEGMRGWDFMTEEVGGMDALKQRYYGPQTASDQGLERRHVLVLHYSYQIPTLNKPVAKWILAGWEASGVSTFLTGDPINPSCGVTGLAGIAFNDPSLTGVASRCEFVAGQNVFSGYDPTGNDATRAAFEDQYHFNPNAFQRPLPLVNGTNAVAIANNAVVPANAVGNTGNIPWGILRNPNWSNWDFTLARRLPIKIGRGGNVRIQIQMYNVFNQVEFNTMNSSFTFNSANATGGLGGGNTNTNTGKYTDVQNPFNGSITIRFDY